jgi:hypothetical protein
LGYSTPTVAGRLDSQEKIADKLAGQQGVGPIGLIAELRVGRDAEEVISGGNEVGGVMGRIGRIGGDLIGSAEDAAGSGAAAGQGD